MPVLTKMLWTDADPLPVAEVSVLLSHACGSVAGSVFAPLDESDALEHAETRWAPIVEHFTASFQSVEGKCICVCESD